MNFTKKIGEEVRLAISGLKGLSSIGKSSELKSWDSILQNLRDSIAEISSSALQLGPEEAIKPIAEMLSIRDTILVKTLHGLLHKKLVLWNELGICQEPRSESLQILQRALHQKSDNGYAPAKIEYIHPENQSSLVSSLEQIVDEISAMGSLINLSFQLTNRTEKNAKSLREEIEKARKEAIRYEKDSQVYRSMYKNFDARELNTLGRELDDLRDHYRLTHNNLDRLEKEKTALATWKQEVSDKMQDLQKKLNSINVTVNPRLEVIEKTQKQMVSELKKIRQDADLLPEMFRNEVKLKLMIREEKLVAEGKMKQAQNELQNIKDMRGGLENDRDRHAKIAMHAKASRSIIEKTLKQTQEKISALEAKLKAAEDVAAESKTAQDYWKKEFQLMQDHVYSLNTKINDLEDQKKSLLDNLKSHGIQSKAHHTHRRMQDFVNP